jgi:hypothetical protein
VLSECPLRLPKRADVQEKTSVACWETTHALRCLLAEDEPGATTFFMSGLRKFFIAVKDEWCSEDHRKKMVLGIKTCFIGSISCKPCGELVS